MEMGKGKKKTLKQYHPPLHSPSLFPFFYFAAAAASFSSSSARFLRMP